MYILWFGSLSAQTVKRPYEIVIVIVIVIVLMMKVFSLFYRCFDYQFQAANNLYPITCIYNNV